MSDCNLGIIHSVGLQPPKLLATFFTLLHTVLQDASYGYCIGYYAMYISCQLPLPSLVGSTIFFDSEHYVAQFAAA
jgi:hypothetical protein